MTARRNPRRVSKRRRGEEWGDAFRARLRVLVTSKGGQAAFRRLTGVAPASLSEWLTTGLPSVEMLGKVQATTGVSVDWLLLGPGGDAPRYVGESRDEASIAADLAAAVERRVKERATPTRLPGEREHRAHIRERWKLDATKFFERCVEQGERDADFETAVLFHVLEHGAPKRGEFGYRKSPRATKRR